MAGQTGQPFHLTHTMSFSCITAAVKCQIGSHIKRASEATYTDTMYILLMVYCKPTFIWKTLFRDEPEINWFVATNFYSVVITTILPKFVSVRIICDDEAFANLTIISCMQIKLVLHIP